MPRRILVCLPVLLVLVGASARAASWGDLTGRFVYDGTAPAPKPLAITKDPEICGKHNLVDETLKVGAKGELADMIIYLRTPAKPAVHPDYAKTATEKVPLDNRNCQFIPHVQLVRTTQPLAITNSDPTGHNTNIASFNNPFNQTIPNNEAVLTTCSKEEKVPVKVTCNVHPWMKGILVVRSNPYMAASSEAGQINIAKLPAGKELEFQLWHETCGYVKGTGVKGLKVDSRGRFKMTLKPGKNDLGVIRISGGTLVGRG